MSCPALATCAPAKALTRDEYYACLVERRDNDSETRAHNKASAEFEKRLAAFQKKRARSG